MPPTQTRADLNVFFDVVTELLQEIPLDQGRFPGPVPASVERIYDIKAADAELPATLMQFVEENVEALSAQLHWSDIHFIVWCVTANPEAPDEDLHELCGNVKMKLMVDGEARLKQRMPGRDPSEIFFDGRKSLAQVANVDGKAAIGLLFHGGFKWSHTAR